MTPNLSVAARRAVAAWLAVGALAAVFTGLIVLVVPSNRSNYSRLLAVALEMGFAVLLLWASWRLWRARVHATLVAAALLIAQIPAFYGIGASYQCAAPIGVYARVFLFSGAFTEYPFLERAPVDALPAFPPPISGYYVDHWAVCGGTLTPDDPPARDPRSFGWISVNLAAMMALVLLLASVRFGLSALLRRASV